MHEELLRVANRSLLATEDLDSLVAEELRTWSSGSKGELHVSAEKASELRYLALCRVFLAACEELFSESAAGARSAEDRGLPSIRQASIARLTFLRAEIDGCAALAEEVSAFEKESLSTSRLTGASKDPGTLPGSTGGGSSVLVLQEARLLALVKCVSHALGKTLSTCSFLLSEDAAIDSILVNRALVFFAKLGTLFGAAGNPGVINHRLAGVVGLHAVQPSRS